MKLKNQLRADSAGGVKVKIISKQQNDTDIYVVMNTKN